MPTSPPSAIILIVEDDPNDVLFLTRAFKKAGVRQDLRVVRDGEEAIEYLAGEGQFRDRGAFPAPCLVLLDLKLPKKNGLEVLKWLRRQEEYRDLPVVMITSSDHNGDREAAENHGVEAFLVKPVALDDLIRIADAIRVEAEDHCEEKSSPSPGTG